MQTFTKKLNLKKIIFKVIKVLFNTKKQKILMPLFALHRYDFSNWLKIEFIYKLNQRLKLFRYKKNKNLNIDFLEGNLVKFIYNNQEFYINFKVVDSGFNFSNTIAGSLKIVNSDNIFDINLLKLNNLKENVLHIYLVYPLPLSLKKWEKWNDLLEFFKLNNILFKHFRLRGFSVLIFIIHKEGI